MDLANDGKPYPYSLSDFTFPMTACPPSRTSTRSMRMTCDPPLLSRRNVSTKVAKVRDNILRKQRHSGTLNTVTQFYCENNLGRAKAVGP